MKEDHHMKLFSKKEKIILNSEQQKDDFIEKLEKANVHYVIRAEKDEGYNGRQSYIVRVDAEDLKKVV